MTPTNKRYLNRPQREFVYTGAHTNIVVGGRRLGKSHGFAAPYTQRNTMLMPRSTGGIICETYQQALTRTLPGTLAALEDFGYKRNVHFYVNQRPPKSANFQTPIINPPSYEHSIIFFNGSIWRLISQDRPGTSNSLTLDWLFGDEAKFLDYDKLKDETFPANGGYTGHFGHLPWHHSMLFISDMPTSKKGSWFLKYKEMADEEVIQVIHGIIHEMWRIKNRYQEDPKPYHLRRLKELHKKLNELRSIAIYYREWSSIQNLLVLGEKYIKQMKRDLPPLVFATSIMSVRVTRLRDGFYSGYNENLHSYTAFDNSYLDSLNYNFKKASKESCLQDGDLDRNRPICIGLDYNANINWLVVGQRSGLKMHVLKSFYVKYERKLNELIDDFCSYYEQHQSREVIYYYDNTALGTNYAVGNDDFASVVEHRLDFHGWRVTRVHIGNPVPHKDKHMWLDQAFKGLKWLFPMFNRNHNEALLLAIEQTGTRIGSRGFQKDKSGEKLAESEEDQLEFRTDGTDAFDTLFIGMNKFPQADGNGFDIVSTFA